MLTPEPRGIIAFPYWRDNPYLNMLYLAARARGWELRRSTVLESLLSQLDEARSGDVIHLHWTSPILQRASTEAEAWTRLASFVDSVTAALAKGCKLIWTVHNKMPHECPFPQPELALARFLADNASAIHVLSAGTTAAVADLYELPVEKVVHIRHSSYCGVYDQSLSRNEARTRLGLADDEKAVLFFGQMRAYKGIDVLIHSVENAIARGGNVVLLLAGKTKAEDLPEIDALISPSLRVVREHTYIADEATQEWFAAADLAVFPYRNVLNSGSVHLAATFGVPTILPRQQHVIRQFESQSWVRFYDPERATESLTEQILDFHDPLRQLSDAALRFARAYTPYDMAREYLLCVESLEA